MLKNKNIIVLGGLGRIGLGCVEEIIKNSNLKLKAEELGTMVDLVNSKKEQVENSIVGDFKIFSKTLDFQEEESEGNLH